LNSTMGDQSSILQSSSSLGPLSRWNAEHRTVLQAPVQFVWESLVDTASWQWNPYVRLSANVVLTGASGKASIAVRSRRWKIREFTFGEVNRDTFTFSWTAVVGSCRVTNVIKLYPDGSKATKIHHTQKFSGFSPGLRWNLPVQKMKSYPMCINEALKNHVESRHFNHLLVTLSTREMSTATDFTESMELSEASSFRANFWESSPRLRRQLLSTFLDEKRTSPP